MDITDNQVLTEPVTVNDILASWSRERSSDELQGFVSRKLSNEELQAEPLELEA